MMNLKHTFPFRHPSDYRLIASINSDFENTVSGYKHLFRFAFGENTPDGFQDVSIINNEPVMGDDGILFPKYWALPRYGIDRNGK